MLHDPKLKCSECWFALNLVREDCELWSLVMSVDGRILQGGGDFFWGGTGIGDFSTFLC